MDRDFTPNFPLKHIFKDLNLMVSAAYELNLPLPVTASVMELYGAAMSCGNPDEDYCSVIRALEMLTGLEVKKE
ncbi:MAG: NAD-binding protein [Armatimonadetes bacterium]|nr:NAD-binding protein [Armatimonadota bacterium]